MKKIDLGQSIAILANIGVIAGIAFLALEMRLNRELVRAQIHQSRADAFASDRQALADSEFLLPAYAKVLAAGGISDPENLGVLDEIERERMRRYQQARYADYDNQFYQYRLGYLDDSYYNSRVVRSIRTLTPLWLELGITTEGTPEFQAEIQRINSEE